MGGHYMRIFEGPDGRKFRVSRSYLREMIEEAIIAEKERDREEEDAPSVQVSSDGSPDRPRKKDAGAPRNMPPQSAPPEVEEVPDAEDPADDEIAAQAGEGDDDALEPRSGKLADDLVGKTVQSVTMEPKSKLIPGSQEVVLTFNEITDPLRIIVAKNGKLSFFFRGSLHNLI